MPVDSVLYGVGIGLTDYSAVIDSALLEYLTPCSEGVKEFQSTADSGLFDNAHDEGFWSTEPILGQADPSKSAPPTPAA